MRNSRPRAFTLIELLVSIGIIVILVGLLLPAVMRANKSGMRLRMAGDLQTIAVSLEAYKQDFGDIPRLPTYPATTGTVYAGNPVANTGAAILGMALLGPYGDGTIPNTVAPPYDPADPPLFQMIAYHPGDCVRQNVGSAQQYVCIQEIPATGIALTNYSYWEDFTATDNADGPGFKVRAGAAKVWGPYIQPGKIKNQGVDLLDPTGSPILYFPAHLGSIDVTKDSGNPATEPYVSNPLANPAVSLYGASDNLQAFYRSGETSPANDAVVLNRIRILLGNYSCGGFIDSTKGDTPVNQPYLLWSAGPDGVFGPAGYTPDPTNPAANQKAVSNCDDVTNFR
jgi:prepilin-type N-terminal cleavage/methylation domain-containing protein